MAGTLPAAHDLLIHADTIVANSEHERLLAVLQLGLDVTPPRVLSGVAHGFASDTVHIISNEWGDTPRFALHHDAKGGGAQFIRGELLSQRRECVGKLARDRNRTR